MPAALQPKGVVGKAADTDWAAERHRLHRDGWARLQGGMPEWELVGFVERAYRKYSRRITRRLEEQHADWSLPDDGGGGGPGAHRPGGLVARRATEDLAGTGIYIYAAHPSQADEEEAEDAYSGPRWYVSCMEAVMQRYSRRGVAPPPPAELQELLWPEARDRCCPWLTEAGWTCVPENSDPQVMHADICSCTSQNSRQSGQGRYHHFGWKFSPTENCTTQVVPGAFTEGCVEWDHYKNFLRLEAPAVIFDSEMIHRGAPTGAGRGWAGTLTLQVCSGSGWPELSERVSEAMMFYTQPLGWVVGDAVDAWLEGAWQPARVESRSGAGLYQVALVAQGRSAGGLRDRDLRYRGLRTDAGSTSSASFQVGALVEALFEQEWHAAKISRRNADGTYKVTWRCERSCTDGVQAVDVRTADGAPQGWASLDGASTDDGVGGVEPPHKQRRCLAPAAPTN